MTPLYWFLLGLSMVAGYVGYTYNRFVGLRQRLRNSYSDIDVQLKRRWDLTPALVEIVRGYAGHEHEVFRKIAAARGRAMAREGGPDSPQRRGADEAGLAHALRGLFLLAEDYPALRADRSFLQLHRALVVLENDLQYARRYYNAVVRDLNTLRDRFPSGAVGAVAGVPRAEYFQIEAEERAAPILDLAVVDRETEGES